MSSPTTPRSVPALSPTRPPCSPRPVVRCSTSSCWRRRSKSPLREGDTWATVRLQMHLATARASLDPVDANVALLDRAIELGRAAGDEGGVVQALGIAAVLAAAGGRPSLARSYLRQLEGLDLREYSHAYLVAQGNSIVCFQAGRYQEGRRHHRGVARRGTTGASVGPALHARADSVVPRGPRSLDRALALMPPREQTGLWEGYVCVLRAERTLLDGDIEGAIAGAEEAHRVGAAGTPSSSVSLAAAMLAAEAGAHTSPSGSSRRDVPSSMTTARSSAWPRRERWSRWHATSVLWSSSSSSTIS